MISMIASAVLLRALASDVEGTVLLASGKPAANAVVSLEGAERARPLAKFTVDQRDHRFVPHVSVVTVGTRVQFPNNDIVFHNVFTEYHAARFDLGMYAKGQSKSQVFDRAGVAVLMCSIHTDMSAYIAVVDTPYYAITDSRGKFVIHGVPSGSYTVKTWHESGQTNSQKLTVTSGFGQLNIRISR